MLSSEFLQAFKRETEQKWSKSSINPAIYGYQFQAGTRWNLGLSEQQILAYESEIGIHFPLDLKEFLRAMNGTDLPTLNIHEGSGEPTREWVGVYSYPRELESVRRRIDEAAKDRDTLTATMADQGFTLPPTAKLMPIYAHRCVVCDDKEADCVVLSVWDPKDTIVYGYTLQEYLEREFLGKAPCWAA
jgi:hypothetical protein